MEAVVIKKRFYLTVFIRQPMDYGGQVAVNDLRRSDKTFVFIMISNPKPVKYFALPDGKGPVRAPGQSLNLGRKDTV